MEPKKSTRRDLIKQIGAIALVGGGLYSLSRYFKPQTSAEVAFDEFPEELPGAAEIRKYRVSGAKKCLVHIRQKHLVEGYKPGTEDFEEVKTIQTDIYKILKEIVEKEISREFYVEAISPEMQELVESSTKLDKLINETHFNEKKSLIRRISELEKEIIGLENGSIVPLGPITFYPNDENAVEKYISDLNEEIDTLRTRLPEAEEFEAKYAQYQRDKIAYGAVHKLASEKDIKIMPAESLRGNIEASNLFDKIKNGEEVTVGEWSQIVQENRENILLQNISTISENPLAITIYGGNHDWANNINEWNEKNPDNKYSLIEITPMNYEKRE